MLTSAFISCAAEEGDQQRFWRMTRKYAETLSSVTEGTRMKVVSLQHCSLHGSHLQATQKLDSTP